MRNENARTSKMDGKTRTKGKSGIFYERKRKNIRD
jgi:hypothetical protein